MPQYLAKLNHFEIHAALAFGNLYHSITVPRDVTIYCENDRLDLHKLVLATTSAYFRRLIRMQVRNHFEHLYISINTLPLVILSKIVHLMYFGNVILEAHEVESFGRALEYFEMTIDHEVKINRIKTNEGDTADPSSQGSAASSASSSSSSFVTGSGHPPLMRTCSGNQEFCEIHGPSPFLKEMSKQQQQRGWFQSPQVNLAQAPAGLPNFPLYPCLPFETQIQIVDSSLAASTSTATAATGGSAVQLPRPAKAMHQQQRFYNFPRPGSSFTYASQLVQFSYPPIFTSTGNVPTRWGEQQRMPMGGNRGGEILGRPYGYHQHPRLHHHRRHQPPLTDICNPSESADSSQGSAAIVDEPKPESNEKQKPK